MVALSDVQELAETPVIMCGISFEKIEMIVDSFQTYSYDEVVSKYKSCGSARGNVQYAIAFDHSEERLRLGIILTIKFSSLLVEHAVTGRILGDRLILQECWSLVVAKVAVS